MIVAAVILPTQGGLIGELLFFDEVDPAQFGGVHVQLNRQNLDHPLDEVDGLCHAERTAVTDTARRLVGIDAIDGEIGHRDVIGARADVHESGRELGRVGASVKPTVVGRCVAPKAKDLTLFGGCDLTLHPIVPGEGRGHQIVHPVFDPLDRLACHDGGHDRTDITRIGAHLVAKATADIRRHHADVVLFDAGN